MIMGLGRRPPKHGSGITIALIPGVLRIVSGSLADAKPPGALLLLFDVGNVVYYRQQCILGLKLRFLTEYLCEQ